MKQYEIMTLDELYKARTPGAKDKKPRRKRGKKQPWDYKIEQGQFPRDLIDATVWRISKDLLMPKYKVKKHIKNILEEKKQRYLSEKKINV